MIAEEFVRKLSSVAPPIESLLEIGLSETEAESFRDRYVCKPKSIPLPLIASNEILDLVIQWDVNLMEIGMVRLLDTPSIHRGSGIQIGFVEADPLVMLDTSLELVVEELGTTGHILWKSAQSPGQFLDALLVAANFFSKRTVGVVDFDDSETAKTTADECASIAGGDEHIDFYYMLLGAE